MFRSSASSKAPAAPHFPTYLLPSLKIPFLRRRRSSTNTASSAASDQVPSLSGSPSSPTSISGAAIETFALPDDKPLSQPLQKQPEQPPSRASKRDRLLRNLPDVLRCNTCGTDVAFGLQIVSKGFTGRHGRALLVSPPLAAPTPSCPGSGSASSSGSNTPVSPGHHTLARDGANLVNITVGRPEPRNLVTGAHVVADINCSTCGVKIGWKYVDAREQAQKYKVGKFILETERVVLFRSWEDARPGDEDLSRHFYSASAPAGTFGGRRKSSPSGGHRKQSCSSEGADGGKGYVVDEDSSTGESEEIVFDSEDEDECEDIFAGVWDAATVARRRGSKMISRREKRKDRVSNRDR